MSSLTSEDRARVDGYAEDAAAYAGSKYGNDVQWLTSLIDRLAPQAAAAGQSQWRCHRCHQIVPPSHVTFSECHDGECGGGCYVESGADPLPPDIAEIEKRHRFDDEFRPFSALMNDQILETMEAAHSDRAALLAHIRSRQGVVDRKALAKWFRECGKFYYGVTKDAVLRAMSENDAYTLIASGIVKAVPGREECIAAVRAAGLHSVDHYGPTPEEAADAILALVK